MNYSFKDYRKRDRILLRCGLSFVVKQMNKSKTAKNMRRNASKNIRYLEIGPGLTRLNGFETLNIIDGKAVDYIADISQKLPFLNNSFDLIYASHVIEHVPWFLQKQLFSEFYRILKPEGKIEIWVPNFKKVLETVTTYYQTGENLTGNDGWYRFNEEKDVMMWANGRIFTYGDGTANPMSFNWHRCVFTQEFLTKLYADAGFTHITPMDRTEVRGMDHGWINLGVKAKKE